MCHLIHIKTGTHMHIMFSPYSLLSPVATLRTAKMNIQKYVMHTKYTYSYVFCVDLQTNIHNFLIQN
jgi:hypothetical protein